MCATTEAVEGSQLMDQLHIFFLNEVKTASANLIAGIIMDTTCPSLHLDLLAELEHAGSLGLMRMVTSVCACVCSLVLQRWDAARIQKKISEVRFVLLMAHHRNSQDVLQDVPSVQLPRWILHKCVFSSPLPQVT